MTDLDVLLLYATFGYEGVLEGAPLEVAAIVRGALSHFEISDVCERTVLENLCAGGEMLLRDDSSRARYLRLSGLTACIANTSPEHRHALEYRFSFRLEAGTETLLKAAESYAQAACRAHPLRDIDARHGAYARACAELLQRWADDIVAAPTQSPE